MTEKTEKLIIQTLTALIKRLKSIEKKQEIIERNTIEMIDFLNEIKED